MFNLYKFQKKGVAEINFAFANEMEDANILQGLNPHINGHLVVSSR